MKLSEHIRKIGKQILVVQILSIFWVNLVFCEVNEEEVQITELLNEVTEVVNALKDYQYLKWYRDPNLTKSRLPELYSIVAKKRPSIIENCLPLYRARILSDMERREEMIKLAKAQVNSLDRPDLLPLLLTFNRENGGEDDLNKMRSELGRILPLSNWGDSRDHKLSPPSPPFVKIIGLRPPDIPNIRPTFGNIQNILAKIGDYYKDLGFIDDALNLYIESFYSTKPVFNKDGNSILGELWLNIADIEKNRGNKQLSIKAYFNAVFYWREFAEQAKKGITEVLSSESKTNKDIISEKSKLPKDIALKIADLYKKLNLHPLALAVLERSEKDTGESLSSEKDEILKEWHKILKQLERYYQLKNIDPNIEIDFHVLGQKVSKVKDWAKIKLSRPTETFWK